MPPTPPHAVPQGAPQRVAALIVAAGRGLRMGGEVPKQFQDLAGRPVLARTVERLAGHPAVAATVVVVHPDDADQAAAMLGGHAALVPGGATRAASVAAGLAALGDDITHVLIHDAARPLVPHEVIDRVLAALATGPAAAPALAVTDALWRGEDGKVAATPSRAGLWRAQTPQGFALPAIRAAHAAAPPDAADDVEVARAAGLPVRIVEGHEDNIKPTVPADRARAARILAAQQQEGTDGMEIRLGNGYDVHRFGPGAGVILCGVEVPHDRALQGHSDADVGMHAITDAIYGALAAGDIGRHFPPSDPQWRGAASDIFLRHAVDLAGARGYRIGNIDCTLVCERPKVGPHAEAMRARLAAITGTAVERIGVKATTSERLGFTGREEGIAALATATLIGGAP